MATLPGALAGARIAGERFARSRRRQNPEGRMPLADHLRELRTRVIKIALALAAGMTAGFIFFGPAWHIIERPLCAAQIRGHSGCRTLGVDQLVLNGPLDAFYLRIKVALIAGVILSAPAWLYQVWAFAAPGLHARERRWSYLFLGAAIPLFGIGITLCYLSLGRSMRYLLGLTPGGGTSPVLLGGPVIIDIRAALITDGALVTAAQIGQSTRTISPATAAALVLAGVLPAGFFPGTALAVLADHRREVPGD